MSWRRISLNYCFSESAKCQINTDFCSGSVIVLICEYVKIIHLFSVYLYNIILWLHCQQYRYWVIYRTGNRNVLITHSNCDRHSPTVPSCSSATRFIFQILNSYRIFISHDFFCSSPHLFLLFRKILHNLWFHIEFLIDFLLNW